MGTHFDAIVIGAGPAGLSAAACLAEMGLEVLTLDEQNQPGGQLFCNIETALPKNRYLFGDDYDRGVKLAARFRKSGAGYENSASVWQVDPDGKICYSQSGKSRQIRANYVIAATGAMERPMPFPGWNLPGVMGAGAVNKLAKQASLRPSGKVVLAGSGPLLLLEATLLIKKGIHISAILETTPAFPTVSAFSHVPKALRRTDFLWKGVSMLREIKAAKIDFHRGVTHIRALGQDTLCAVEAQCGNKRLDVKTDLLLVHFGVIPNTHIFRQMGCRMSWKKDQRYWYPACDEWGRTNFEQIFAAGDGALVSGGLAAQYKGELAALEVARCLGIIPDYERDALALSLKAAVKHDGYPRPFVDAVYAPPEHLFFEDNTVLCRCENVTVGDVRKAVREGGRELNEIKIMTRTGMGPCQGRMCGPALAEVVAAQLAISCDKTGLLNIRPPLKPIPLGEIANIALEPPWEAANLILNDES